ncbi:MAG TPA: HTH domain-containing protein, partial [Anaeromyxobacter sp.]
MTFTEAAIEVLRREGKPLHFGKIAEIAVRENLLDHVGKVPEETMAGQLAAHCRLPSADRRVIAVQPGTFALVEWDLEEDPAGLEGLVEAPPEQELPYRSKERHPVPSRDLSRASAREGRGRRREEEERRGRKFPPPAEVAYEILAGAARPLALAEIAAQGAERLLMPDAFVRDVGSLRAALSEDNRRREASDRKAMFQIDGDTVTLVARPEPGERVAVPAPVIRAASTPQELRRAGLAAIRRRLRECDGPTFEHVVGKVLEKLGFRELKVAKRGREHVVYTARRRMGLADVRHGIRILRGGGDVARREVGDLRRDLGHYGAQIGVILSTGDAARDARGDASAAGQLPVVLYCGEALAEALVDAGLGCVPVVVPDVDEEFFRAAAEAAEQEEAARRARREERERREPREGREGGERRREERGGAHAQEAERAEPAAAAEPGAEPAIVEIDLQSPRLSAEPGPAPEDDAEGEGEDEGPDDEPETGAREAGTQEGAAEGAEGERRRRRRRRRRRGGRG